MYKWLSIFAATILLGGCTTFSPAGRSGPPLAMPPQYTLYSAGEPAADRWWEAFGSSQLNGLVEAALADNFDIKTAWARIRQAEAMARQAGAKRMPVVEFELGGATTRSQIKPSSQADRVSSEEKSWDAGLAASYEVDLWGRLRAQQQAEIHDYQAAREDLVSAAMTVAASVVDTWVDILTTQRKIDILEGQIKTNQTLLDLQMLRFVNGKAGALDVSQQREALAAAKAQLPLLQVNERQLYSLMAVLLGRTAIEDLGQDVMPDIIPLPTTGVPADLLSDRPDVRAAGLRLQSADWAVSAARADRLPNFTISSRAAFSSGHLDLLFDNWIMSLAGSIAGPIFDAGQRSAEVDRTRAVAQEALADYARTVAEAIREVEDNLVAEIRQQEYIALLRDQLDATRVTLKDARLQYMNGKSDYLAYLTAWNSVQSLERQMAEETAARIKFRVALYRALGKHWTEPNDGAIGS
jgi:NodT family efflux transporter outer membrane factor (OMF) lipoprotein